MRMGKESKCLFVSYASIRGAEEARGNVRNKKAMIC